MNAPIEKRSYVHPHGAPSRGTILMVASSPATSAQTGWPIGFWAAELTHPSWYAANDIITLGYLQKPEFISMLETTRKLTMVNQRYYDAIFLVGGQGPMYTFKGNADLQKLLVSFMKQENPQRLFATPPRFYWKLKNQLVNY